MIKEFLFSWISKPQYLLTMVDYTKAIIEIFAVLVGIYGIARLIEKFIKKMNWYMKLSAIEEETEMEKIRRSLIKNHVEERLKNYINFSSFMHGLPKENINKTINKED